jgi:enoyl-CoA hydratase/carnithine racemase
MSDDGTVRLVIEDGIAKITFDRPGSRNAMTWAMYETLANACTEIAGRDDVRVVLLRGAGGKAFIAGTDIAQFLAFETGADGVDYEMRIAQYVSAVANLPMPTVAVVEGWAVGGGMAIASVCDFRLSTPGARFGVPIARTLGNCLSAGNLRVLLSTLGMPLVKRMLLLAEMIPAEELTSGGYVHEIVEADALEQRVTDFCSQLAGHAPVTMAVTKEALSRIIESQAVADSDLIERAYASRDFHEGVRSFVDKRPPQWVGR